MVQVRRTIFATERVPRYVAKGHSLKYFEQGFTRCASACAASAPLVSSRSIPRFAGLTALSMSKGHNDWNF
jgi:hypothetical protein